ncbi:hypothetical protein JXL83_03015 [candidate division WOR-3 bacterium]|nr:hypothetical protein [candidate division WOR-3 bacterium]
MKIFTCLMLLFSSSLFSQREHHMRDFEAIRLWEMAQHLELTEEQMASIIRIHRENSELLSQMHSRRSELIEDLKKEISLNSRDENILSLVAEITDIDLTFQEIREKERENMFTVLTPVQKGKFYIFQVEFAKRVREHLSEPR